MRIDRLDHLVLTVADTGTRVEFYSRVSLLGLDAAGAPVLKGYASYDDIWALEEGEWRLAYRETVLYGYAPSRPA